MGSFVELNDTLQITKAQGFPVELDIEKHLDAPYETKDFENTVFEFKNKDGVRIYHIPPVRTLLVENVDGKWIYWGLCHVIEVTTDNINKTTSGKYKIIHLNSPEEMKIAHSIIDRNPETQYFK